jgi:hypothetical protein
MKDPLNTLEGAANWRSFMKRAATGTASVGWKPECLKLWLLYMAQESKLLRLPQKRWQRGALEPRITQFN